ncbi:unnamed protein product [Spirodela intermedia]|uniref:Homeobox domain-containing protein n=1 Tax=Spirodela intermedia TaxID=51605 RepID=A0A7I8ISG1_SPIIN|nr:unnamed protein product [Spirodela intermedia]CAA6660509.1 unnamed protein product [Spirodela intermedia]
MSISVPHDISAVHGSLPRVHYNLWNPTTNSGIDAAAQQIRRPSMAPLAQQGLSLSLSPQQASYGQYRQDREMLVSPSSTSEATNGMPGLQGMLMGSKYLKAAQQLLDEVVNFSKGVKDDSPKASKNQMKANRDADEGAGEEVGLKRASELTTVERQELQMKKAKLAGMLDEVEQRYRQYHQQMQIVVSSFEAMAGFGSARTYTSLALQTISKQFRCLKDAITGQIRATSRRRLQARFVDHHLRQQRALQQLGMMQHNAWRPQRGLPERAVSVLRAWLFEHFLHPYPKDTDKLMLAKQTGLTRSQVSNWFINARVRLWKPMVEEMYMEETKDQEHQHNNGDDRPSKRELNEDSGGPMEGSPSGTQKQADSLLTREDDSTNPKLNPSMIPTSDLAGIIRMKETAPYGDDSSLTLEKFKKARAEEASLHMNGLPHAMHMGMDFKPIATNRDFFTVNRRSVEDGGYSFGAFPMGDLGRFDPEQFAPRFSGNGVSLTLGLPHCESLSLSGTQPSFLSAESIPLGRRLEIGGETGDFCNLRNNAPGTHPSNAFENINMQNRKGFAAPLLPDFVT